MPSGPTKTVVPSRISRALAYALEGAEAEKRGFFTLEPEFWGGFLLPNASRGIAHELQRGQTHCFWAGTTADRVKISVHIYDAEGQLVESESSQQPHWASARIRPKQNGTYYIIVRHETAVKDLTDTSRDWALVYGLDY